MVREVNIRRRGHAIQRAVDALLAPQREHVVHQQQQPRVVIEFPREGRHHAGGQVGERLHEALQALERHYLLVLHARPRQQALLVQRQEQRLERDNRLRKRLESLHRMDLLVSEPRRLEGHPCPREGGHRPERQLVDLLRVQLADLHRERLVGHHQVVAQHEDVPVEGHVLAIEVLGGLQLQRLHEDARRHQFAACEEMLESRQLNALLRRHGLEHGGVPIVALLNDSEIPDDVGAGSGLEIVLTQGSHPERVHVRDRLAVSTAHHEIACRL
mmetsp:Transcript_58212/g.189743  ORF Transcript_58212/g.189743 Transcript_58212/m.189743 type:complete len:272 (-) Transcript_58212:112-927(-)